jgi:hypothetical protein
MPSVFVRLGQLLMKRSVRRAQKQKARRFTSGLFADNEANYLSFVSL